MLRRRVLESIRREVAEKVMGLSITEGGKERKSKVIASCSDLGETCQVYSKRENCRSCNQRVHIRSLFEDEDENKWESKRRTGERSVT